MPLEDQRNEFDIRHLVRLLRRRYWVLAVSEAVVVSLVVALSLVQTPTYTATAEVLLQPSSAASLLGQGGASGGLTPDYVQTQANLVTSAQVKDRVRSSIGSAPMVSVSDVGTTDVIDVTATSVDPRQAARIANNYANAYIYVRQSQEISTVTSASAAIQSRISDLDKQIESLNLTLQLHSSPKEAPTTLPSSSVQLQTLQNQEAALRAQLAQLEVNGALSTGSAQLVTPAVPPKAPTFPRTKLYVALAVVFGMMLGIILAVAFDYLDDSIRTLEDIRHASGQLPVLGIIPEADSSPDASKPRLISLVQPTSPVAEAYRSLRTSVQFMGLDTPIRRLQITSPIAEEGKTTTVANLGVAMAKSGQKVILVCCDLRRPRLHEFFEMSNAFGFTSVLLGEANLDEVIQPVKGLDTLWILPSGPLPPNPSELLASKRAAESFESLQAAVDLVIVDSPPVLPVTDAAVISTRVDATIVVARAGATTRRALQRALEVLRQVDAPIVGAVLGGLSEKGGYGYGYGYYRQPEPQKARVHRRISTPA